jgi:hypothetical protein
MPSWARTFVLLTGMTAWLAIVGVSLWLGQIPSAVVVGFPPVLWTALAGVNTITRKRAAVKKEAAADEEADPA